MAAMATTIDSMVKEYLIFRGFTATLKCFDTELRNDSSKSFKVEKILEQFHQYIQSYDISSLKKYWRYFEKCYFCQLGHETYKLIKKLEINLLRLYVVHAIQNNKSDRVSEFFEKYATELQLEDAWKDWFILPFMKNAEQSKFFGIYFTKIWQESVILSLANCLDTIFSQLTLPMLLNFEKEKSRLDLVQNENHKLHVQLVSYQRELRQIHSLSEKCNASTQTNPDMDDNGRKSVLSNKNRFGGWKLLGSSKENKTAKKDFQQKHLSLDENTLVKSSTRIPNIDRSDFVDAPGSSKQNISLKKSMSHSGASLEASSWLTMSDTMNKMRQYYAEDNQDAPFIVLSQDEFKEHTSAITSCKFSDHSNSVASVDLDGTLKIWQCYPSISSTSSLSLNSDILSVDWLPRIEDKVLLGRSNGQVGLYDISSNKYLWESMTSPTFKRVISLTCSPSSATAVCSSASHAVKLQPNNKVNNKLIKMKQYSALGDSTSTKQGVVTVWDLQNGQLKSTLSLDPFPVCIHSLSYNHNGTLLVTGGADGMIRLFDIRNSDCLVGWHAHSNAVVDVMFNVHETSIFSIGADGKLCVWDINKVSSKIVEYPLPPDSTGIHYYANDSNYSEDPPCGRLLCCHSEGEYMMACGGSGLMIYQMDGQASIEEAMHIVCPSSAVTTLDWSSSPNCSTAVCGTKKGTIQISTLLRR